MNVLVVDGDQTVRAWVPAILSRAGCAVSVADCAYSARAAMAERTIDVLLLDVDLPDGMGFELLRWLRVSAAPPRRIVVLSSMHQVTSIERARELGAHAYLTKPFRTADLVSLVRCQGVAAA